MRLPTALASSMAAAAVLLTSGSAHAQDLPDLTRISEFVRWGGVAASFPIFLGATFIIRIIDSVGERFSARFSNRRPTIQKVQTTARFLIYVATIAIIVGVSIKLDATTLAVIGGALAFAVGSAMRDVVASFIAGITIMFDRPFQVGDRVGYGGEYGDIIKIGLRSVRMNTLDHRIITIPNNKVFTDVTASSNYGLLESQVEMSFYIGVDQDAQSAIDLIREACLTSPYVYLNQPIPVFAQQIILQNYVAVHLIARAYVFDVKYEEPFKTDVHMRVMQAFRDHSVHPPAVLQRVLSISMPSEPPSSPPRQA